MGETSGKGYVWQDFEEVFRRYVPRSEVETFKAEWLTPRLSKEKAPVGATAPVERKNHKLVLPEDDDDDDEDERE